MQSSRPSGLRGLLAVALGAMAAVAHVPLGVRFAAARMQSREEKQARIAARARGEYAGRGRRGKRYPEQSDRQALRGFRRAQRGPGITEGANPRPRLDGEGMILVDGRLLKRWG